MKWIQTPDSEAVLRFGYDPARRILSVTYHEGETYDYLLVPARVFAAMQAAPSKGQFVTAHVKGSYEFRKR
jgi:hypothetical protein